MSADKRNRLIDLAAARALVAAGYQDLARALFARHGIQLAAAVSADDLRVVSADDLRVASASAATEAAASDLRVVLPVKVRA